jgi:hypothetical protein
MALLNVILNFSFNKNISILMEQKENLNLDLKQNDDMDMKSQLTKSLFNDRKINREQKIKEVEENSERIKELIIRDNLEDFKKLNIKDVINENFENFGLKKDQAKYKYFYYSKVGLDYYINSKNYSDHYLISKYKNIDLIKWDIF